MLGFNPNLMFHLLLVSSLSVVYAASGVGEVSGNNAATGENLFAPKAYLLRYWSQKVSNDHLSKPSSFLISKASPLTAVESAYFTKLAGDPKSLSDQLPSFCSSANLFCFPDSASGKDQSSPNSAFAVYKSKNFTTYGLDQHGSQSSFKNYSTPESDTLHSFRSYSRGSTSNDDKFSSYAVNRNYISQNFTGYGDAASGGTGNFKEYNDGSNVPNLKFKSYSGDSSGRKQSFTSYSNDANGGEQIFASYGKNGDGLKHEFTNYEKGSNLIWSRFKRYGEGAMKGNDSFTTYGSSGSMPQNRFKSYGQGGKGVVDTFTSYNQQAGSLEGSSFSNYANSSNSAKVKFSSYSSQFGAGRTDFKTYAKGSLGNKVDFKSYVESTPFKEYVKEGVTFSEYNRSFSTDSVKTVNKLVEPGKFFRESMLTKGTVMPMPDIRDKMPKRSFLPRGISSKLPFSSSKLGGLKQIFHASDESSMSNMLIDAVSECERAPSQGETKKCVGSVEDMIDFAVSVLGKNVAVRSTENTVGSNQNVMVGSVQGINGGRVTQAVSCHQTLYPYLLYYCHSVPKVRVYEADLLDPKTNAMINRGVAIRHLDTSSWSASHGAFVALGSAPGKIEVCHWIFENDMTWTLAI